jgi:hypothetical protein
MGKSAVNKKTGEFVTCSKAMIPRKYFMCPRNKSGYKTAGFKKCLGCGYANYTKNKNDDGKK